MKREVSDRCGHFPKGVPIGHVCSARVVVVGEAPGERENEAGVPFVGPAGYRLSRLMSESRIPANDLYITNVLTQQPINNDLRRVASEEVATAPDRLRERIRRGCPSATIVVPVGNLALASLTTVDWSPYLDNQGSVITKWRGSLMESTIGLKCIPTIHPAAILREPLLMKCALHDWLALAAERESRGPVHPRPRTHLIHPSHKDVIDYGKYIRMHQQRGGVMAWDVETGYDGIICVGFACDPDLSITLMWDEWQPTIMEWLSWPISKVGQNIHFDMYHIWWVTKQVVKNVLYSIDHMFHALDPRPAPTSGSGDADDPNAGRARIKPYSLAYMSSMFARGYTYWKDEAKEENESNHIKLSMMVHAPEWWDRFLTYNGKDCTYTWEDFDSIRWHLMHPEVSYYRCLHEREHE